MVNVGSAIGYLLLDTSRWTGSLGRARSELDAFRDETATAADKFTAMGKGLGSVGSMLTMGVTAPLVGLGAAAVTTAMDFESSMSNVAAISGATGEQLEELSSFAREMGATTAFSASEAADAMGYMAMAGWDTQQMMDGLPGILNLAAASGEDLATTSDIVTDALTAFGLSAKDAEHFANVMAAASSSANTNVSLMGETFKYVAPVAGALGMSVEDAALAIGLMANAGIKGSQAGTAFRAILNRLSTDANGAGKALEGLGVKLFDNEGNMRSWRDIMVESRAAMAGMTQEEQVYYANKIAGQEASSAWLAMMNASEQDFLKTLEAVDSAQEGQGAAAEMAATMLDNLSGQITILKSGIQELLITFGDILLPYIKKAVSFLQGLITWLNNLDESQKNILATVMVIAAALGPVLLIVGKVLTTIGAIMPLISGAGGIGAAIAGLANPITAVIAVIALLVAAWVTDFGGIREATAEIFEALKTIFTEALDLILYIWNNDIGNIKTIIIDAFILIRQYVYDALNLIVDIVQLFAAVFEGDWDTVWQKAKEILSDAMKLISDLFNNALHLLLDILTGMNQLFHDAAVSLITFLWNGIKAKWNELMEWFNAVKEDPVGTIVNTGEAMFNAGSEIFTQLWNGLKSVWESITTWVQEKVDWLESKIKFWENSGSVFSNSSVGGNGAPSSKGLVYSVESAANAASNIANAGSLSNTVSNIGGDTIIINSPTELSPTKTARAYTQAKKQLALGAR